MQLTAGGRTAIQLNSFQLNSFQPNSLKTSTTQSRWLLQQSRRDRLIGFINLCCSGEQAIEIQLVDSSQFFVENPMAL